MSHSLKKLEKSEIELIITVAPADYEKHNKKAAERISERTAIKGFRKGKVPFDVVKKEVGEMAILQEAIDDIIMKTYYEIIKENKLVTLGQPQIDVEKVAPENPFVYKATVSVLPAVKLADPKKISLKREEIKITVEQVEKIKEEIRAMRATEKKVEREAKLGDLVKIDFSVYRDGVPIENGKSQNYSLLLGENRFIPGFEEQLVGRDARRFHVVGVDVAVGVGGVAAHGFVLDVGGLHGGRGEEAGAGLLHAGPGGFGGVGLALEVRVVLQGDGDAALERERVPGLDGRLRGPTCGHSKAGKCQAQQCISHLGVPGRNRDDGHDIGLAGSGQPGLQSAMRDMLSHAGRWSYHAR